MLGLLLSARLDDVSGVAMKKILVAFLGGVAVLIGAIAGILEIKHDLERAASFSGNLGNPVSAAKIVSFLQGHTNSKVAISATCNVSSGICSMGPGQGNQTNVTFYAGPNRNESAVLTFVPVSGGSGSLSGPGAGSIP
jgi:hypothetical protein